MGSIEELIARLMVGNSNPSEKTFNWLFLLVLTLMLVAVAAGVALWWVTQPK